MKYYIDCEFDGYQGPLLSMAIVSETGRSMYAVMAESARDPWVQNNVIPYLFCVPPDDIQHLSLHTTTGSLSFMIEAFIGRDFAPHIIADWPDDLKYFSEAIITGPGVMINIPGIKMSVKRVDAYPTTLDGAIQHNAWWDAMALRHLFRQRLEGQSDAE